jgi:general secretion pathway protein D
MIDFRLIFTNAARAGLPGMGLTAVALAVLLSGCASGQLARHQGMSLLAESKYEEGLGLLAESVRLNPGSAELRKDYLFQRGVIVDRMLADAAAQRRANRLDAAEVYYRRIYAMEPSNAAAQQGMTELEAQRRHARLLDEAESLLKMGDSAGARALLNVVTVENPGEARAARIRYQLEEPSLKEQLAGPTLNIKGRKPLTLQFRDANLKMVMEAISRATGVNILLDKEVRNDIKVTIFVRDTSVEETLDLLLIQNQLEKRVLGENTVLLYPATSAKSKDYQDLKVRRFTLGNADPKQVQTMLKTILKIKDIFVDEKSSAVVIRDTPDAVRLAEKLVLSMDQPEPEVMLEIDVMQVDRNRMLSLGIDWTKSFTWSLRDKMSLLDFKKRTSADVSLSGLSVTANASKTDGDVNDLATPRIRVRNKEKAKILVGTRNPVVSSAATPAPTGGGSTVYNTSVTYIETGIKLEVEPNIHPDGDVAIKINLEVSSAGAQIDTGSSGTVVFPINTNNVTTLLQLKDGETQILGGLLQQQSDQSQTKIPGAGDVPLLGRLFGTTRDSWNKKELLLAITPHIIRNIPTGEADLVEMWTGTDAKLRFGAPNLKASGGSGVLGVAGPSAVPSATAASTAPQTPVLRPSPTRRPVVPGAVAPAPAAPDAAPAADTNEPAAKPAPGATQ